MKRILQILSVCALSTFIGSPNFDLQAAEKTITAKFSLQFPPQHHLVRAVNFFTKIVAEKSWGSTKIQAFPAGQICKETEIVDAVRSLSVEGGNVLIERRGGSLSFSMF
jgi:TRAP-type C4-dicarboxylate transport system substrate-binding protein